LNASQGIDAGGLVVVGVTTVAAGSVSAPSITPTGDSNTGIFFPAADTIAFGEGGSEALRIDSSGRVGIGTDSPIGVLAVSGGVSNPTITFQNGSATNTSSDALIGSVVGYSRTTGGHINVGSIDIRTDTSNATSGLIRFLIASNGVLSETLRINSSGRVGINNVDPKTKLDIGGTISEKNGITFARGTVPTDLSAAQSSICSQHNGILGNSECMTYQAFSHKFIDTSGGTLYMVMMPGGNSGIGTTHTSNNIQAKFGIFNQDGSPGESAVLRVNRPNNLSSNPATDNRWAALRISDHQSNIPLAIVDQSSNPLFQVFGNGNVGIGTTVISDSRFSLVIRRPGEHFAKLIATSINNSNELYWETSYSDLSRYTRIGLSRHASITNASSFISMVTDTPDARHLYLDTSANFRISSTFSHVGTTNGTVVGTQTSDERLKNIESKSFQYGLNEIKKLIPIHYTFKSDPNTPKIGFSAQQVISIIPESVYDTKERIDSDGNLIIDSTDVVGVGTTSNESVDIGTTSEQVEMTKLGMEYVSLVPVLVKALQEISDRLDQIEIHVGIAST